MAADDSPLKNEPQRRAGYGWALDLLLVLVLLAGAYFRFVGLSWDEDQHLHPDERFLTMVESSISPVDGLGEYFNTQASTLNPNNVGHGFFVYGTLPIFLVRYVAEWVGQVGYGQVHLVGRALAGGADLLAVFLIYLVAARLYDRRVGLLAAAFSAAAVLPIQLSHYLTVDPFLSLFTLLALYFAIRVATGGENSPAQGGAGPQIEGGESRSAPALFNPWLFVLFGVALSMAVASKVSAAPLAVALPLAVVVRMSRLSPQERQEQTLNAFAYLALAGLVSLLVFRVFQPYAFSGPGFFGLSLNPRWLESLQSLRAQASGDGDWPPGIQWARRPIWFALENIVRWGLGWPLGLLAWAGFLWMGWRVFTGEWRRHLILWSWTGFYFAWQSTPLNPTMRYHLPVYHPLALMAAWALVSLWDRAAEPAGEGRRRARWTRPAAAVLGAAVLVGTYAYAFAFTRIYTTPEPRIAAARWIYQNLPGPITLPIETNGETFNQQLPFPYDRAISPDMPYLTSFTPRVSGALSEVRLKYVLAPLRLSLLQPGSPEGALLAEASQVVDLSASEAGEVEGLTFQLSQPLALTPGDAYLLRLEIPSGSGAVQLQALALRGGDPGEPTDMALLLSPESVEAGETYELPFSVEQEATVREVYADLAVRQPLNPDPRPLRLTLAADPDMNEVLATSELTAETTVDKGALIEGQRFRLDPPLEVSDEKTYFLQLEVPPGGSPVSLEGTAVANETSWDVGLPLRIDGYDGFGGIYQREHNLDIYADDSPEKLDRFLHILDNVEYIFIASSRQWASTPRIPERYPLTSAYYRYLLGCPQDRAIEWCYNVAEVGTFEGGLGFELVRVFKSYPTLGPLEFNDQPSEEAFTVYDHPKAFVFRKSEEYDSGKVAALLGAVDLSSVIHLSPRAASRQPSSNLMLPPDRLASQRRGGTWSEMFDVEAIFNRFQPLGVAFWYAAVGLLGLTVYPLVRAALPGLADRGYPFARTAGLLLLSYGSWLAGSVGVPFTRATVGVVWLLLAVAGGFVAYRQREGLRRAWREQRRYFLLVEGLFLAFFLFDLLVRLGNPDLWHPAKGGEKPMDFSYFNAVLKSTSFPPYDPWFAGGYINYYYYGFVYVGALVKLLGILPSFAYNLILPTLFALMAMGAFSIAWNVYRAYRERNGEEDAKPISDPSGRAKLSGEGGRAASPWLVGLAGSLGMAVLGNLGTLQMIFRGWQRLGAVGGYHEEAFILTKWVWAARGFFASLLGEPLPYGLGEWYWNPSRVIPDNVINEFPWFTVLYADLHAHLMALPLTLLALAWALSVLLGRAWQGNRSPWAVGWGLVFGGLAVGALFPANTWDLPTYLALGAAALIYAVLRYYQPEGSRLKRALGRDGTRLVAVLGGVALLAALSIWLYQPYHQWYLRSYSSLDLWDGSTTRVNAYLTHWGLFLFVLACWMLWETRQWMAATPLSALRRLEPYRGWIQAAAVALVVILFGLVLYGVAVAWIALPLALWAGVLLLRPGAPDAKRAVLFMAGTALTLTLAVEIVRLEGDVGRMNTVFKFYLQAWTLFAVSSAAALGWTLSETRLWAPRWRGAWQVALAALVASAALFTFLGTLAKVQDRMTSEAPYTLDGMTYMRYASFSDFGVEMDLEQDYEAIRWLQENVEGSPVIVEANIPEYRWGTRYTIYTGLPGVLGWNWHQRQQRGQVSDAEVWERVAEIENFYTTGDRDLIEDFLRTYDVRYIIVGQLEHAAYPNIPPGKFDRLDGVLWRQVYRNEGTVIYEVLDEALARK